MKSPKERSQRGPFPLLVLVEPRAVFAALRDRSSGRRAMVWLACSLPLLPVSIAIMSYGALQSAFLRQETLSGKAGAVPFIVVLFFVATCLVQVAMLGIHLVVFTTVARWLGATGGPRAIRAVWAYSVLPLVLRQLVYTIVIAIQGVDWFKQRAGLLVYLDPFIVVVAVLLFIGARQVLELSRGKAVVAALSATFIGALGALFKITG